MLDFYSDDEVPGGEEDVGAGGEEDVKPSLIVEQGNRLQQAWQSYKHFESLR